LFFKKGGWSDFKDHAEMRIDKSAWQRENRRTLCNFDGVKTETGRRSPTRPALLIAGMGVGVEDRMRPIVVTTLCE